MKSFFTLLLFTGCFLCGLCQSQNGLDKVRAEVRGVAFDPVLEHGLLGFFLCDSSGTELIGHNAFLSFIPASTFKTIVSSTALVLLGPEYRFRTYIETDGDLRDGVLKGNLYIRGGGDPSLGSDRIKGYPAYDSLFLIWADSLQRMGIKRIEGRIIGDASAFDEELPITWTWNDMGNYYGAGPSGLCINDNGYTAYFHPGKYAGQTSEFLKTWPVLDSVRFFNEMKTGPAGSDDNSNIFGSPFLNLRWLRGTIPAGKDTFTIKGSLPDPALLDAQEFRKTLLKKGIQVDGFASTFRIDRMNGTAMGDDRRMLFVHQGAKLSEVVYWLNKKSINLYAENLLKLLGREFKSEGSADAGIKVVKDFWKAKGIDTNGWNMWDGSGLSRYNQITPKQMGTILWLMTKEKCFPEFYNSLSVAGDPEDPGTVAGIGTGTIIAKNLRAKSGFIAGVRGFTGYVRDKSGDLLIFVAIANQFSCGPTEMRSKLTKIMISLGEIE